MYGDILRPVDGTSGMPNDAVVSYWLLYAPPSRPHKSELGYVMWIPPRSPSPSTQKTKMKFLLKGFFLKR